MSLPLAAVLFTILAGAFLSYRFNKLTLWAALTGGTIATIIYFASGLNGIALLAGFFILTTLATSHHKEKKRRYNISAHQAQRTTGQVIANGGVAALAGLLICFTDINKQLLEIMLAASLSSATADTLSSELGVIYGKRFYNVITWKKDEKGLDGVVSLEGTLMGLLGSIVIAAIYVLGHDTMLDAVVIVLAGTAGNLSDSILGATLERRGYINNNLVNLLNTLIGAIMGALLFYLIR